MPEKKTHEETMAEYWARKMTLEQRAIAEQVQASVRKHAAPGPSPSDELTAERRAEAARESEEIYSFRDSEEEPRRGHRGVLGDRADA